MKLDRYDLAILRILSQDGRMTKSRLAEEINLSISPAWERVRRLEESGIIRGYRADVDWLRAFKGSRVIVEVTLARHTAHDMRRFEERIAGGARSRAMPRNGRRRRLCDARDVAQYRPLSALHRFIADRRTRHRKVLHLHRHERREEHGGRAARMGRTMRLPGETERRPVSRQKITGAEGAKIRKTRIPQAAKAENSPLGATRTVTDIRRIQEVVMLLGHPVLFKSLCYVDGRWVHSAQRSTVAVQNPADQEVLGHVPMLDAAQITEAVDAAHHAFTSGVGCRSLNVRRCCCAGTN